MPRVAVDKQARTTGETNKYVEIGVELGSLFPADRLFCGKPRRNAFIQGKAGPKPAIRGRSRTKSES
jgi:hypothetical protein